MNLFLSCFLLTSIMTQPLVAMIFVIEKDELGRIVVNEKDISMPTIWHEGHLYKVRVIEHSEECCCSNEL